MIKFLIFTAILMPYIIAMIIHEHKAVIADVAAKARAININIHINADGLENALSEIIKATKKATAAMQHFGVSVGEISRSKKP